jgi:hypothetical protein
VAADDPVEVLVGDASGESGRLGASRDGQPDVDALPQVLLGVGTIRQAVAGEDEGEHGRPSVDPIGGTGRAGCTELVEDREALQVHSVGPVGSEPDTWLLVAAGQSGWAVIEWAPVVGPEASPPF